MGQTDTGTNPTAIRGRRHERRVRKRTSLSLRADVLRSAKELVRAGEARNLSAFVEAALEEKLRRVRRAALHAAYEEAARDNEFLTTMRGVSEEFSDADSDGL